MFKLIRNIVNCYNLMFLHQLTLFNFLHNLKTLFCSKNKKSKFNLKIFLNLNFLLSNSPTTDLLHLEGLFLNKMSLSVDSIKIQELTFLPEYFLITALFCLTLFALFSLKLIVEEKHYLVKFQYNNQLIFLLIFVLVSYLILVYQQLNLSLLELTSFNDTIYNDQLALISKLIIGVSSILYLIFITQYLKDQKLNNFEYSIILLTSIFGFFLLCSANDLITAYLAIELQGLAFYVLASFKKSSNFSIESGVKYFVLGSLSTALFLLGVTFLYGLSGSVVLTDFKDFFIWVFSANSFFFSFESISKALGVFLENNDTISNSRSALTKLQMISDKLDLLKKKAHLLSSEIEFSTFENFSSTTTNLYEIELSQSVSRKITELRNNIDSNFFLSYQDSKISWDKSLLQTITISPVINDFTIESSFENALVDLIYVAPENKLSYDNFLNLKDNLLEANFYETANFEKLSGISLKKIELIAESKKLFQISSSLDTDFCLNSLANLSNCSFFGVDEISYIHYFEGYEALFKNTILSNTDSFDSMKSPNVLTARSYLLSIANIVNCSDLFLEAPNLNEINQPFMFDFSFVVFGMVIIILALFFKLALAPFHLWAPDVYEGSPSSSTFFFMVISKFSIFVFLLRICYSSFYSLISYWQFYSLIVATISIFIGAVGGLKQRRLKSLLTYSSINNMGFVLLAFSVGSFEGVQVKFYYLIVYMLASLCIWSIILNLKLKKKMYSEKQNRDLGDLALLHESNNVVAQSLGITLFSMAGLPPMVGFLAKMGVFKALSGVSIYFFSVINILFSVIATFYYLRIVKIIFFENLLVGNLYVTMSSKKTFLINLLSFLLLFLFISPMFLYLYSYKITLFLNKSFY